MNAELALFVVMLPALGGIALLPVIGPLAIIPVSVSLVALLFFIVAVILGGENA